VNSYLISQGNNSPKRVEKRFQTNLRVNPLIDLNCKLDKLKSSLYPIDANVSQETNDLANKVSYTKVKNILEIFFATYETISNNFEFRLIMKSIQL
jgi:hypothetical protein